MSKIEIIETCENNGARGVFTQTIEGAWDFAFMTTNNQIWLVNRDGVVPTAHHDGKEEWNGELVNTWTAAVTSVAFSNASIPPTNPYTPFYNLGTDEAAIAGKALQAVEEAWAYDVTQVGHDMFVGYLNVGSNADLFTNDMMTISGDVALTSAYLGGCTTNGIATNARKSQSDRIIDTVYETNPRYNFADYASAPYVKYVLTGRLAELIKDGTLTGYDDLVEWIDDTYSPFSDIFTDWVIAIGPGKAPKIGISWNTPGLEKNEEYQPGNARAKIMVNSGSGAQTIGIYAYPNHHVTLDWMHLAEVAGLPGVRKVLSNLTEGLGYVQLTFCIEYTGTSGVFNTSTCYASVDYNGEVGSYGVYPPEDGSSVKIEEGGDPDDTYIDFPDDIDEIEDPELPDPSHGGYSGIGVLTKTYVMDLAKLKALGRFLWTRDFFDMIQPNNNAPLDNVVSCKAFPFTIGGSGSHRVVLGNVDTRIDAPEVGEGYNCKKTIGSIRITRRYGDDANYLNTNTFTTLSIFLPYAGFYQLDASLFLDKVLKVDLIADIIHGDCKYVVYADNIPIADYDGIIGSDIALSSTNRAEVEAGIIGNVGGALLSAATGNLGGILNNALGLATAQFRTETTGTSSPTCNNFETHQVYVTIESPEVQWPSNYNHVHGRPCNLTRQLGNLSGFTVCDANVDLSGINATKAELDEIRNLLTEGVYM